MNKKEFKTIGLIAEDIGTDYTQDIIYSIYNAIPEDKNIRVFTLASKVIDSGNADEGKTDYIQIYNSVLFLSGSIRFDGFIIALGSLRNMEKEQLDSYLKMFGGVPRVFISADVNDGVVIRYDNASGISEVVDLLVNIGNLSRFAMLGGREDNYDAVERHELFRSCLKKRGITLPERAYVPTDMSINCHAAAEKLLDDNPLVEAIFCVNDTVAKPLYDVMKKRGLTPGKDIKVFGFDNTRLAAGLDPPLSSIGPTDVTIGKRALEILMSMLDNKEIEYEKVPTKLYSRASLEYDILDRTTFDVYKMTREDIDMIFDRCFYRYKNEIYSREDVNLKRLFNEIIRRIIRAMKNRYMSEDEYRRISKLIDIFIDNGAMDHTDPQRFVKSINRLQAAINVSQKSVAANLPINRLFLRIKDRMIYILSGQKDTVERKNAIETERLKRYLMSGFNRMETSEDPAEVSIRMLEKLGLSNLLFYMFETPFIYGSGADKFPGEIDLRCMIKDKQLYVLSKDKRSGTIPEMFSREEIPSNCKGYIGFPVFCQDHIFGLLACEPRRNIYGMGELIAAELGRTLFVNENKLYSKEV